MTVYALKVDYKLLTLKLVQGLEMSSQQGLVLRSVIFVWSDLRLQMCVCVRVCACMRAFVQYILLNERVCMWSITEEYTNSELYDHEEGSRDSPVSL